MQGGPETVGGSSAGLPSGSGLQDATTSTGTREPCAVPGDRRSDERGALEREEFSDVISTLHDLRQELEDDDQSSVTDDASIDGTELRHRGGTVVPGETDEYTF